MYVHILYTLYAYWWVFANHITHCSVFFEQSVYVFTTKAKFNERNGIEHEFVELFCRRRCRIQCCYLFVDIVVVVDIVFVVVVVIFVRIDFVAMEIDECQ